MAGLRTDNPLGIEAVIANIPERTTGHGLILARYGRLAQVVLAHGEVIGDDQNYDYGRALHIGERALRVNTMVDWGTDYPATISYALGRGDTIRTADVVVIPLDGERSLAQASSATGFADYQDLVRKDISAVIRNMVAWTPTEAELLESLKQFEAFTDEAGVVAA